MPYQPPLSMRIASDEPEDRTKILVGSSELDPKVKVEALTDEAAAVATAIVRAAARWARGNVMSGLSLRIGPLTVQRASAAHLRQYAAGGPL